MSPSVQLLLSVDINIFRYPSLCAELLLLVTLKALIGRVRWISRVRRVGGRVWRRIWRIDRWTVIE